MDTTEKSSTQYQPWDIIRNDMSVWHWLVMIGTTLGITITGLLPHSFGTLIANFKSSINNTHNPSLFNATQFQLNWLPALSSAIPCLLLPLFAIIIQKLNRSYQILSAIGFVILGISCGLTSLVSSWSVIFLTYSLLYSLGSSLFLAVTTIILAEYFPVEHRLHVMATSLFQIGYPAAAFIGNPVLAVLIVHYGWTTALKCVSIFEVICGILIALMMKPLKEKGFCKYNENTSDEYLTNNEHRTFSENQRTFSTTSLHHFIYSFEIWPWLFGKFLNYMCWYGLRTNIVTYLVKSTDFGLERSASLMSMYAAAEVIVSIVASLSGDTFRGWLLHIHIIAAATLAILTGIFTVTITSYLSAALLMISLGVCVQFSLNFGYPASAEVLEKNFEMKAGWIFTNVAAGLGIFISPLFSGILMDKFTINSLFYAQCFGWSLQTILFSLTLYLIRSNENRPNPDYQELKLEN